eukprot:TRINITY_DN25226_c0_g1_i1.p1 TRINITY_DN25226_c0_g1~~TRINITY_DN25226_c0_g1_i1.p1  ORF type:complete len:486 (+),score=235.14 TRINITY_DN25226_c0_g1_i1:87-1544(+)
MPAKKGKSGMGSRSVAKRMKYTGRTTSKANKSSTMKRRIKLKGTGNPNVKRAGSKKLQPWEKATAKRNKQAKAAGVFAYGGDGMEVDNPYEEEDVVVPEGVGRNQKKLHDWIQSDKQAREEAKVSRKKTKNKFKHPEVHAAKAAQKAEAAAAAAPPAAKGKAKKRKASDAGAQPPQPPSKKPRRAAPAKPAVVGSAPAVADEMARAMALLAGKPLPPVAAVPATAEVDIYTEDESMDDVDLDDDDLSLPEDDDFLGEESDDDDGYGGDDEEAPEDDGAEEEDGEEDAVMGKADNAAPLQEGRSATLHGSFAPMQRIRTKRKSRAPVKAGDDDSDAELPDEDDDDEGKPKLKSKPNFTSFSAINKSVPKPVFGEVAQQPPKLVVPADKRSLMPAHIKKKKLQEMMMRLAEGGPAEEGRPKMEEAGQRVAPDFLAMQKAARDGYAAYKDREKKKFAAALAASKKPVSRAAKRKMNAADHTQEVSDFV